MMAVPVRARAKRRSARQSRAQQTVQRILDAAAARLAADGLVAVTTTRLAADTGLAVGSLYQYFADRDAVLLALHQRRMAALAEMLDGDLARLPARAGWETVVDHLIDHFLAAVTEEPGYVALIRFVASRRRHDDPLAVIGALEAPIAVALRRIAAGLPPAEFDVVLRVAATMLSALADLALCQDDVKARGAMLYELRFAMKGYLARFASR
ncbi:MAG: TetR/AcrR family transcriptional regulator [Alphaproteobacteria bacterium]|nr:MAG: TetR/AcrR family transcriptional regulator [Alphaproteobacteria bacterium]